MKRAFAALIAVVAFASNVQAGLEGNYTGNIEIKMWTSTETKSCIVEGARLNLIASGNSMYLWIEGQCEGNPIYVNEYFLISGNTIVHDGATCGLIDQTSFECRDIQGGDRNWSITRTGDGLTYHYKGYLDEDDGQTEIRGHISVR